MENADAEAVLRNADFAAIAAQGTRYEGSRAVAHPSQPNYLALVAGDTFVRDDGAHDIDATNVVDLLEAGGISWGAYLEGWPGGCSPAATATGADGLRYVRKHDPFISFDDIRTDPARCARLVPGGQLAADLEAGTLPQYVFYAPDLVHDGHDSSVVVAGRWLSGFLGPLLGDPRVGATLVVITYDEGGDAADPGGQPIFTVAIGPGTTPGRVDRRPSTTSACCAPSRTTGASARSAATTPTPSRSPSRRGRRAERPQATGTTAAGAAVRVGTDPSTWTTARFRPACFAWYSAVSARETSSS